MASVTWASTGSPLTQVDVSGIGIDSDRPTGSAFVEYRADGSRDFVFQQVIVRVAHCPRAMRCRR